MVRRSFRRLTLIAAVLCSLPGAAGAFVPSAGNTVRAELSFSPDQVRIAADYGNLGRLLLESPGAQSTPGGVETVAFLVLPAGSAPVSVSVRGIESVELPGVAGQLPEFRRGQVHGPDVALGTDAGTGWMRGTQIQSVRIRPLYRDPLSGELSLWTRIEISVTTRPADVPDGIWQPERAETGGHQSFKDVLRTMVLNPADVETASPRIKTPVLKPDSFSGDAFSPLFRPSVDGSPVEYLIITTEALAPHFNRLVEWRLKTGTSTALRTVEWIAGQYSEGVDLPDKIRRFIRDASTRWGTLYVLMGGDFDQVPMRYAHITYYGGEEIPTDLYYQCLDRNWNENGNHWFGEGASPGGGLPADNADLFPEVFLGRIPCSTPEGLNAVLDKTFQYERTPPLTLDYVPTYLALAEMLQPINWNQGDTVVFDGTFFTEQAITRLPAGFRASRLYENYQDPRWSASAKPLFKQTALDSIDAGFGIVHHVGHGFRNNLSVGIGGLEIVREDADRFANTQEPFLFFGINCNSASLDFDSIAEHFLCRPGGAFAYMGSTRFDFPGSDDPYQNEFFRLVFLGEPIAQAHALAKVLSVPSSLFDNAARWHQMSLVALSEPLVRIRTAVPFPLSVTHPQSLTLGASATITVQRAGQPLAGARVTLYKAGDVFSTGQTNAQGMISLSCPADEAGLVSLTVTHQNAVPYSVDIPAAVPAGPFVTITGLRTDDSISGNGDGRLDAGETADLHFRVTNSGGTTAGNVTLTFSTAETTLTVLQPSAQIQDLTPGETDSVSLSGAIRVRASSSVTSAADAPSTLLLSWTGGGRSEKVGLRIGGGNLWILSQQFRDDPGGAGEDSVITAGEMVDVSLSVMNRGASRIDSVTVRLASADNRVTLAQPSAFLGSLAPGGSGETTPPLRFSVSDTTALSTIQVVVSSASGELSRRTLDVKRPDRANTPTGFSKPRSIILSWNPKFDGDIRGYAVLRSTSAAGPFTRVNPVADNPMGYYEDGGLLGLTRYYYKIAAQDRAGNLGPESAVTTFITSYAALENWPLTRNAGSPSSPVVHDLDGDGVPEVISAGQEIYAVHADGSEFFDGDRDSRTLGILTQTGGANFWSTPAVADVDNDGILEIVCAGWGDGKLYVFGVDGAVQPGWPRRLGGREGEAGAALPWGSPLLIDVDGDGTLEIFITGDRFLYGFHHDGTEVRDGDANPATVGVFRDLGTAFNYGSAAGADFDHDGRPEIVLGTRNGTILLLKADGTVLYTKNYSTGLATSITGSPAIADLDKDGELEMIFPVRNLLEVHAVNRFGASPPGWPVRISINQDFDASPTVADLDGDTFPDVVMVGGSGRIGLWHGKNGTLFPGFPVDISTQESGQSFIVRGTPCLGDITGDGIPDIVVGTQTASVYAVSVAGEVLPGFPLKALDNIEGGPLLWDIDGDGHTNLLFGSFDKNVYAFDTPGIFNPVSCPWPMFRHDQRNTGFVATSFATPLEPALAGLAARMTPEGVELSWRFGVDGSSAMAGWLVRRQALPDGVEELLAAPSRSGGGVVTLVDGSALPGTRYSYRVSGIDRSGREIRFAPIPFLVPEGSAPMLPFLGNSPNPFHHATAISYTVAGAGEAPRPVRLDVFDVQGRRVRTLVDDPQAPGSYTTPWDARNDQGRQVEAGVYFYRLTAGGETLTRKLTVIR